jgi:hypothetical protein
MILDPFRNALCLLCLTAGMLFTTMPVTAQRPDQDTLKATYIYKFLEFIKWPHVSSAEELRVCLYGDPNLAPRLKEVFRAGAARKRQAPPQLTLKHDPDECAECEILVLNTERREEITRVLRRVSALPVLTISQGEGFSELGVTINFFLDDDGYLRFEINRDAMKAANLQISAHLLSLAYRRKEG